MIVFFKNRAGIPEKMDAPEASAAEVDKALKYVDFVNSTLGGYKVLIRGLSFLLARRSSKKELQILDVGCGGGYQIRFLERWLFKRNKSVRVAGLDFNPASIVRARRLPGNENVQIHCCDALSPEFRYSNYDIVVCSLFMHHLNDQEVVKLLKTWNKSGVAVLVNDLHRSGIAWVLFNLFALITRAPEMARFDGAASVRNAFKKKELLEFGRQSGFDNVKIKWRWAFRYELILYNE